MAGHKSYFLNGGLNAVQDIAVCYAPLVIFVAVERAGMIEPLIGGLKKYCLYGADLIGVQTVHFLSLKFKSVGCCWYDSGNPIGSAFPTSLSAPFVPPFSFNNIGCDTGHR